MKERTPINSNLKTYFEQIVLKQLFEDNFFAFVNGNPGNKTEVELAEDLFTLAYSQGYTEFDAVHCTQMRKALKTVLDTYSGICDKYTTLRAQFPDVKFAIRSGWRHYRIYTDGDLGTILKITSEVVIDSGNTALEMYNEDIIKASVWVIDRYNLNYRTEVLKEWVIQPNFVVTKDVIQGNGFVNFIMTKDRETAIDLRTVASASTRKMIKPIPPVPHPMPWPGPGPVPPGPIPPGPFPPGPGPFPPGPGPVPPGPTPHPHPIPPPVPVPGPQPAPIYPPPPPPPAPVPFWPPPPPPPPVIADCALVRRVVAERTVGGIKKGSVLPAGLTFTLFVEWLLRGGDEEEDEDPQGVVNLTTTVPVGAPYAGKLTFTITKLGTANPTSIRFYERPNLTSGATAPREGTVLFETQYVEGQTEYECLLTSMPDHPVLYWAEMDYTRQIAHTDGTMVTTEVPWVPKVEKYLYFMAPRIEDVPEDEDFNNPIPYEEFDPSDYDKDRMIRLTITEDALASESGVTITIIPRGNNEDSTIFIAVPTELDETIHWYSTDGTPEALPDPRRYTVNGVAYTGYLWDSVFDRPNTFVLKDR